MYIKACESVLMHVTAACPVTDIAGVLWRIVFVLGSWAWHPSHTGNRLWPPSCTWNTQEIHTGNHVSTPFLSHTPPCCTPRVELMAKSSAAHSADSLSNFFAVSVHCLLQPAHPTSSTSHTAGSHPQSDFTVVGQIDLPSCLKLESDPSISAVPPVLSLIFFHVTTATSGNILPWFPLCDSTC